jgi:hypothetical protein
MGVDATKAGVLTDLASTTRAVVVADEGLHPAGRDDPMWAESSWWVVTSPPDELIGWVYVLARPHLGVASCGLWFWDASARLPWEIRHSTSYAHIALGDDFDLAAIDWNDHGVSIRCDEPFARHTIQLDLDSLSADLAFTATCPPQPMGIGATTGHLDQALHVTGTLTLDQIGYSIDGPAWRDRTWSSRHETHARRPNCYTWASTADTSFQLLAMLDDTGAPLFHGGFVWRDGVAAPLTTVRRTVTERDALGAPRAWRIDLADRAERTVRATGRAVSTAALPGFAGYTTWATLVRWTLDDGTEMWGEDHDSWPHDTWRRSLRGSEGTTG